MTESLSSIGSSRLLTHLYFLTTSKFSVLMPIRRQRPDETIETFKYIGKLKYNNLLMGILSEILEPALNLLIFTWVFDVEPDFLT